MNTSTVKDLSVGEGFYLPNCDYKGTKPNWTYVCSIIEDDGIYAVGSLETHFGILPNTHFWLPNSTVVETWSETMIELFGSPSSEDLAA